MSNPNNVFMVIGLGFGDEGKGTTVDYLTRTYNLKQVVRFNGTSNAAHNVVLPDGRHHTFSQFGSGTFVPGVRTHMSKHCLFDPISLIQEEKHLQSVGITDAFSRFTVDPECLVITNIHRTMNRLRETKRGHDRHGSTGVGLYEAVKYAEDYPEYSIRVKDLNDKYSLNKKLIKLECHAIDQFGLDYYGPDNLDYGMISYLRLPDGVELWSPSKDDLSKDTIFEGAQGVLLDEWYGFFPYTTRSTTTLKNALELVNEETANACRKIGVLRTYHTRHGAGPFPTEVKERHVSEKHNKQHDYQGNFREGYFDAILMNYAIEASGGINEICLTHDDYFINKVCNLYNIVENGKHVELRNHIEFNKNNTLEDQRKLTDMLFNAEPRYDDDYCEDELDNWYVVEKYLNKPIPVTMVSDGPTYEEKVEFLR